MNANAVLSRSQAIRVEIEFRDVGKSFLDKQTNELRAAVTNISLKIEKGEVVSLIGPSGCGKSTLLNMGSGLYAPTTGKVFVSGNEVTKPVREIAFMLQKDLLMQWRTIEDNVALGLEISGVDRTERRRVANELMAQCHLHGFEKHYPYQLSGGMRQRAALARTLAVDPQVMVLDEPFSALEAQTKMILHQDLAKMLYERKRTALFITHDLVEGIALSDRLLVMSERPGTIIEEIVIDLPLRENPLERRKLPEIGPLQGRLMDLLRIGKEENAVLH
jgi:NitT/TauT family transport system ATP-binding protein